MHVFGVPVPNTVYPVIRRAGKELWDYSKESGQVITTYGDSTDCCKCLCCFIRDWNKSEMRDSMTMILIVMDFHPH